MDLTEDGRIGKHAKQYLYCTRCTLLPYEYECTCIPCEYNVRKSGKAFTMHEALLLLKF